MTDSHGPTVQRQGRDGVAFPVRGRWLGPMANRPLRCVVSVSGIRGIVGDTLDVDQVVALARAFAETLPADTVRGRAVVVGRDSRPTGELFFQAVAAGLRGAGCPVIDIGMVPTPTVPITVALLNAAGGIQISASHNQVEWNALKFFNASARNVDQPHLDRIMNAYQQPGTWCTWNAIGGASRFEGALERHTRLVQDAVDGPMIRAAKLRVVIDSVNGAGSVLAPALLAALGCEVIPVYCRTDLIFPRDPEPNAANVTITGAMVAAAGAHIGFVQDPDADRLAIIDERGHYIGEEYTLVLCAAARMAGIRASAAPPVGEVIACTNLSTSRMLEDVARRYDARVVRSKVGEAHVVDAMQQHQAVIGGEGNGGVIDPRVVWGRDSHIGMALVLESLARSGRPLSRLIDDIPRYHIHKEKVAMDRSAMTAAIVRLSGHTLCAGAMLDTRDGLKLSWSDRWVHVRASGTEPASRVIAEAPDANSAKALAEDIRKAIGAELVSGH